MMTKVARLLVSFMMATLTVFCPVDRAVAGVNTVQILQSTIDAIPSCTEYTATGVCVFLQCQLLPPSCWLNYSLQVRHYVPEVIVSTYHDVNRHPWDDIGSLLAVGSDSIGQILLGGIDSAGTVANRRSAYTFKDADAIGNPVGMFAQLITGNTSALTPPTSFVLPTTAQLSTFPSNGLSQIQAEWASIPAATISAMSAGIQNLVTTAQSLANAPSSIMSSFSTAATNAQTAISAVSGGIPIPSSMTNVSSLAMGPLTSLGSMANAIAGASGFGTGVFCPGAADRFSLFFQSELDTAFWRGYIPVEALYASSWIPGRNEVSQSGANTWGSVYPRVGDMYQNHPVKSSAVVAERVHSIITKDSQPHIYTKLQVQTSGWRYNAIADAYKWQRLYPNPQTSCGKFGQNDSVSLTSYGDFNTTSGSGYMWNLWRRYECCQQMGGSYIFTISF